MHPGKVTTRFIWLCLVTLLSASGVFAWGGRHAAYDHGSRSFRGNSGFYFGSYAYHGWIDQPYYSIDFSIVDPPIGSVFGYIPNGSSLIVVDGIGYYYYRGYYLRPCPAGYIVVSPPEVSPPPVQTPPASAQAYSTPSRGQSEMSKPAQESGAITSSKTELDSKESSGNAIAIGKAVTINIPNSKGGFTAVRLVKYKDGYIGPQDELYPNHPTVDQLRVLYGN
jgi:hypothetical protein